MSILTWQQVTAPDFSTAQRATERAQELILGGIESAKKIPASIDATRQAVRGIEQDFTNQQVALTLQQASTPEALQRQLNQGLLEGKFDGGMRVDPSMISPELIGKIDTRRQFLTDERDNRAEADLTGEALRLAPNDLGAAAKTIADGTYRDQKSVIDAALAANTLSLGKTNLQAAQARAAGKGKGKNDEDKPAGWASAMVKQWAWDKDSITATQEYGVMPPEKKLEIDKALKQQGESAAFLVPFLLGGQDPGSIKKNYAAAPRTQQFFRRQGDVQNELIAQTGKPPPGYDINGTFVRTPTMGEVYDYDNTDVRQMSLKMNLTDSGASGPWQLTPTTRGKAGAALWGDKWRMVPQTIENEKKMAEWVWNNEGADAWEQSLGGFVNAIQAAEGVAPEKRKTPTQYFKEPKNKRSFGDMATFLTTVETGYLPDNFADKTKALEEYVAKKDSQYTRGVEAIITSSANKSENMVDAAARVTAKLVELKAEGIVGTEVLKFMENLEGHAEAKGIDASAGELADLVLHAVETQKWGSWEDVAKDFNIAEGKALTRLSALPTARENLRKLVGDKQNLLEAKAETLKWEEGKSTAEMALSGVRTNPRKFRSLHREFFDVGAASEKLEKIFTRPGADQTRLPTPQELGMPADRSVPAGSAAPLDGSEPKADPGQQAGLRTLAKEGEDPRKTRFREALSKNASQDLFGPKSAVDREKNKILTETVDKKKTALDRLLKVHTGVKDTPEIAKARRELESATFDASVEKGLSALRSGLANNEPDEIIKLREARVKDQSERDYEVSEEEFLDRYMKKFETPSGPSAADTTKAIIEQVKAQQARRAAGEAIAAEDARAIALKKAGAALDFDLTPPEDPAAAKSAQQAALDEIDDLELVPSRATQKREARQKAVLEQLDAEVGVIPGKGAQYGARRKVTSEADAVTAELEKELGNIPGKGAEQAARKRVAREKAAAAELDAELEKEVGNLPGKGAERAARKRRDRILKEAAEEAEAKLKAVREARKNRR